MLQTSLVKDAKKNSIMIANYMVEHATIDGRHFAYSPKEKMLYSYNGKIYVPFEGIDLDKFFYDFMVQYEVTDIWKGSRLTEFERALKVNDMVPRVEMDDSDNLLCFKNGVLDMSTMQFSAHSPKYYFSTYVDVNYDPEVGAEPEVFLEAMQKIFWSAAKGAPDYETIDMIQCLGGALIFPKNKLRQLIILLGGGANGKSVLMNILAMFFPPDNITYLSLEELSTKNLERSRLLKSRVNFCSEEKGGSINSEEIKRIVYGEGITVRRKNKEAIEFIPKTKIVVAANNRPYFNDTSYGLERRLTILTLENMFLPSQKYKKVKKPEDQGVFLAEDDDSLMRKLKKERTQILNFFLIGLKKLVDLGWEMPVSTYASEAKQEYLETNDTAGTWLRENYEVDETGQAQLTPTDILLKYREWYRDNVSTKPLNYAVATMGVKINEVFRLKTKRVNRLGRRITVYPLRQKYATDDNYTESQGDGGGPVVGDRTQVGLPDF